MFMMQKHLSLLKILQNLRIYIRVSTFTIQETILEKMALYIKRIEKFTKQLSMLTQLVLVLLVLHFINFASKSIISLWDRFGVNIGVLVGVS